MTELLDQVIDAHGGQRHWSTLSTIEADVSITGQLWARKGHPDVLKAVHVTARCHEQHISYTPFTAPDRRSVYQPDHVVIETTNRILVAERRQPRAAFAEHTIKTPWDELHLAYFSGYAMWNYLTAPFLFAWPGFKVEEIAPWEGGGERRRRLKVTFPPEVHTHCQEQVVHVDERGLMTRLDYVAPLTGGGPTAHLLSEHKTFSGIVVPTRRRALPRNPDDSAALQPMLVAIDIAEVKLS